MASKTEAKIVLTAEDKTRAAFAAVHGGMERLDKTVGSVTGGLGGLASAFGAAFAVGSTLNFLNSTIDALDALNDSADATGATIENLSALEDVARRNGGTLDDVTSALIKFNQALNSADGEDSKVSQALKSIGLSTKELKSLDPAEALRQVAVALNGYADDGEKARRVQLLFGKSLREAAPFLKDLAESGQLNAKVTTEQAKAAEEFNKNLYALQTSTSTWARSIVADVIPALNSWFENLNKIGGVTGAIASRLGLDQQGKLTAELEGISASIVRTTDSIGRMQTELDRGGDSKLQVRIDKARERLVVLQRQAASTSEQLKALAINMEGGPAGNYSNEGRNASKPGLPGLGGDGKSKKADPLSAIRDAQAQYKSDFLASEKALYAEVQQVAVNTFGAITDAQEQYKNDFLASEKAAYDEISEAAKKTTDEVSVFADQASRNIQDALGDTIEQTLSGNFDNIAELWGRMLQKMLAQAIATKLNEALFSKGGAGTSFVNFFAGMFGGSGSTPPKAAVGANVAAGELYQVNERGTEYWRPNTGGQIIPLGTGQAPAGVQIVNNVPAGVTRAELQQALQLSMQATEASILTKLRRVRAI